ncbi:MAG: prolyl oligopeptidase family serine peptidase [Bacteroidales bacterium]
MKNYIFTQHIKLFLVIIYTIIHISTYAQQNITIQSLTTSDFYPTTLSNIQWKPSEPICSYIRNDSLFTNSIDSQETYITTTTTLTKQLAEKKHSFPTYKWQSPETIRCTYKDIIFDYHTPTHKITQKFSLPSQSYGTRHSQNGDFSYIYKRELYIHTQNTIHKPKVPAGYYISDSIYRNEFGYSQGTFWSPSGKNLMYICKNDTAIPDYQYISTKSLPPEVSTYKYAFAGGNYEDITIGTYSLQNDTSVFLSLRTDKGYYTNPTYNIRENKIYLYHLNRSQDTCHLEEYDTQTGQYIQTLFTETHPKYVEPLHPIFFRNTDSLCYFISRKSGYQHMYSYNINSHTETQITHGKWEISDVHINPSQILVEGTSEENPTNTYIYRITHNSFSVIDSTKGFHTCSAHPQEPYIFTHMQNIDSPANYSLIHTPSNTHQDIYSSKNPLTQYNTPDVTFGTITAADDSTTLHYRMIKPPHFSSAEHYPVIINVYGGPHHQHVTNTWMCGYDISSYILASQGYIIFSLDNRGSSGRGRAFEQITHERLGQIEATDQKKGIDFLHSLPYIDTQRIGTYGWSFGGFMSITLLEQYPQLIHASVAGSPVTDWKYYEVMYGERYMNTPQENPEGYTQSSLFTHADSIQGKLLLLYGGKDNITVPAQNINFIETCNTKGISIETHQFPSQGHHMYGFHKLVSLKKIMQFYTQEL